MILKEHVGPDILLWPFLENKICHMPNTSMPVLGLVPSDAPSPPLPLLCFVCMFLGVHGRHWKETGGQKEGRNQGFLLVFSLNSWSSSVAADPRGQDHRISGFCLTTPLPGSSDLAFPYISPALGVIKASSLCLSLDCLTFSCLASEFFHHMCKQFCALNSIFSKHLETQSPPVFLSGL